MNHVGISLDIEPGPKHAKSENQAITLFGPFLGQIHPGEYACEDSVCLREPMNYTVMAEDDNTFVLCIKRQDVHLDFPEDVVEAMTQNCLRRQEWLQRRSKEIVNGKLENLVEDDEKI